VGSDIVGLLLLLWFWLWLLCSVGGFAFGFGVVMAELVVFGARSGW
jgi:hypothetical protein